MSKDTPRHYAPHHLIWAEMTRQEIVSARDRGSLVIVPTGAIEQHADHLGTETDMMLSTAVSELAAARMTETPVVVAPSVSFGFSPHHLSWPGTISLRLETYLAMLRDVARSILDAGFPRAIFVNGHGGNSAPLRSLVGELVTDGYPIGMVDYFVPSEPDWIPLLKGVLKRGGHACEQETALMLALSGDTARGRIERGLVGQPGRATQPWIAPNHDSDPITAFGGGWPPIFQADDCGYYGDPTKATFENGQAILEATVSRLAEFLEAFARTPLRLGVSHDPQRPSIAKPLGTEAAKS